MFAVRFFLSPSEWKFAHPHREIKGDFRLVTKRSAPPADIGASRADSRWTFDLTWTGRGATTASFHRTMTCSMQKENPVREHNLKHRVFRLNEAGDTLSGDIVCRSTDVITLDVRTCWRAFPLVLYVECDNIAPYGKLKDFMEESA